MPDLHQFLRIESHGYSRLAGRLGEALRDPAYCSHIAKPQKPIVLGDPNAFREAVKEIRSRKQTVQTRSGKTYQRRARVDMRCFSDVIATYPIPCARIGANGRAILMAIKPWIKDVIRFLKSTFKTSAADVYILHLDEEYPHVHVFLSGPAAQRNPGVRAQYVNNVRVSDAKQCVALYRRAMRQLLNAYHAAVGIHYGHRRQAERKGKPLPRLPQRQVHLALKLARSVLERYEDPTLREQLDAALRSVEPAVLRATARLIPSRRQGPGLAVAAAIGELESGEEPVELLPEPVVECFDEMQDEFELSSEDPEIYQEPGEQER